MYKEHPVFEKPENENAKIWRYMDFTKFISLLDNSKLFFARTDKLGDPFEGSYSKANRRMKPTIYKLPNGRQIRSSWSDIYKRLKMFIYINSWHMNKDESAAMWKLYLKSEEGIAIQSTYNRLKDSLRDENHDVFIGTIQYMDYDKEPIPSGNVLYPFVHKRTSFAHEQELRAIIAVLSPMELTLRGKIRPAKSAPRDGITVPVDLAILIDKIYLAPTSPKWLLELVKSVTKKYQLDKEVTQSSLDDVPIY